MDFPCDGLLGREFLKTVNAKICYDDDSVEIGSEKIKMFSIRESQRDAYLSDQIKLPARSETIVQVHARSPGGNDEEAAVVDKKELVKGVYMPAAIVRVNEGIFLTSIVNACEEEQVIDRPWVDVETFKVETQCNVAAINENSLRKGMGSETDVVIDRPKRLLEKLRLGHLNKDERENIMETCKDYADINVKPGTSLINVIPYRIPESQKAEVGKQVNELLDEEYDYEIVYKKGKLNTNADALSRIGGVKESEGKGENIDLIEVTDEKQRKDILYEYHNSPTVDTGV